MGTSGSTLEQPIVVDRSGGVVTINLNRPSHFNALSESLMNAIQCELDKIAADPAVRCVVIGGTGKDFSAGHDLREIRSNRTLAFYIKLFATCSRLMLTIRSIPVPVIARVQGIATAAGCQLVAACDLAIASDTARFAVSGLNVGAFCSTPAVALSRSVSAKRAFDLLVTARFIDAQTAVNWGLVNETAPEAELDEAVAKKVAVILSKSAKAIRYGKQMFYRQRQMALGDAYEYAGEVMARNLMEDDAAEGIDAFLAKRQAHWAS